MKYMNHVKSGLLAMAFACAGMSFTGCEDDVVINTGNSDKLDTVDSIYGYVKSAAVHVNLFRFLFLATRLLPDILF